MNSFIKVNTTLEDDEVQGIQIEMKGNRINLNFMLVKIIESLKESGFKDEEIIAVVRLGLMQDEVKKAKNKSDLHKIFKKTIKDLD